jgi:hypothetical protein
LKEYPKSRAAPQGKKAACIRLAYLSAFAPKLGENIRSAAHATPEHVPLKIAVDGVRCFN